MRCRPIRCLLTCIAATCVFVLLLASCFTLLNDSDAELRSQFNDISFKVVQKRLLPQRRSSGALRLNNISNKSANVQRTRLHSAPAEISTLRANSTDLRQTNVSSDRYKTSLANGNHTVTKSGTNSTDLRQTTVPSDIYKTSVSQRSRESLLKNAFNLEVIELWNASHRTYCSGRFHVYASFFALLSGAIINHDRCRGALAVGGEPISAVLGQNESAEYYTNFTGCFALPCRNESTNDSINARHVRFSGSRNPLNQWLEGLDSSVTNVDDVSQHIEKSFTVVITRFDYANMYLVVNDWYNVYLMARFFDKPPDTINVLLVDAHPRGLFDDTWSVIFGGAKQLYRLPPGRTLFAGGLVWGLMGAGPITKPNTYMERAPYIDDFHQFVVARHGLPDPDERLLDCNNVSVLFIWRHDYVAHPRNPNGTVTRKIANENELIKFIAGRHRDVFRVRGLQLDSLPFVEQLRVVGDTDVMIGMHGAGLSHVTFMPRHGALIELKPKNTHFADLALWRRLIYRSWINDDTKNEVSNTTTRIPVDVVDSLLLSSVADMCANNSMGRRISAFDYHQQMKRENWERKNKMPEQKKLGPKVQLPSLPIPIIRARETSPSRLPMKPAPSKHIAAAGFPERDTK